jgi:hypothetical protein
MYWKKVKDVLKIFYTYCIRFAGMSMHLIYLSDRNPEHILVHMLVHVHVLIETRIHTRYSYLYTYLFLYLYL